MKTKKTSHGPNDQALRQAVWFPENGFGLHIPYEFPDQVLSKTPWIPTILMKALWIECHVRFLALATCRGHWARCLTSIAMSGLTKLLTFEPASIMPWRVRAQVWNKLHDIMSSPKTAVQRKFHTTQVTKLQNLSTGFEENQKLLPKVFNPFIFVGGTQVLHRRTTCARRTKPS